MQILRPFPRTLFPAAFAACLSLAGAGTFAQQPPPSVLANGTGAVAPLPPAPALVPPLPGREVGTATSVVRGQVRQWLLNPDGEADGALLTDGTQVAFPPHLSADVQSLVKPGGNLEVTGWKAPGVPVFRAARLGVPGGRQLEVAPPSTPRPPQADREPAALSAMSASGRVVQVLYTDRGDANGVLLDSGTVVRFAPHAGAQLANTLQRGTTVYARGWGSRTAQGSALEATALGRSADAMQQLFAGPAGGELAPRGPGRRGPGAPGGPPEGRPQPPVAGEAPPPPPAS